MTVRSRERCTCFLMSPRNTVSYWYSPGARSANRTTPCSSVFCRPTTVVRWEEEGKTFEAYIDPFYGIAQRVAVLDLTTEPPKIMGGYEYLEVTYNKVTVDVVTPP